VGAAKVRRQEDATGHSQVVLDVTGELFSFLGGRERQGRKDLAQHWQRIEDRVARNGEAHYRTWGSSISRLHETERWEQILEDSRYAIPREDAKHINDAKPAIQAKKLLIKSSGMAMNEKQFVCIRDYLIARLARENG